MPIFDQFGAWNSLGTVNVSFDWQYFPLFPNTKNSTYRVFHQLNQPPEYFRSLPPLYFRSSFFAGNSYFYSEDWIKRYAKNESGVLDIPYPPDLIVDPLPQRQIQIKFGSRHQHRIYRNNIALSVTLYEKASSNVVYPVGAAAVEVPAEGSFP
jgi:hypothetical protein